MSVNFFVRDSGVGNGCANFMGAWKKCVRSAGKTHAHTIPHFWGGSFGFLGGRGESADFIFMGARTFLKKHRVYTNFFDKFARTLPCFPVTRVRNPTELVQINSFR